MLKRSAILATIICAILFSGCETSKGALAGVGYTAEGVGQDSVNLWQAILKLDKWWRENLW